MPLKQLEPETWGEQVARARRHSGLRYREAADIISQIHLVSYSSLQRLEKLEECPTDVRRRIAGFLAVMLYGFEPEAFGLSASDLPRAVDLKKVATLLARRRLQRELAGHGAPAAA